MSARRTAVFSMNWSDRRRQQLAGFNDPLRIPSAGHQRSGGPQLVDEAVDGPLRGGQQELPAGIVVESRPRVSDVAPVDTGASSFSDMPTAQTLLSIGKSVNPGVDL